MKSFKHINAGSLEEATEWLKKYPGQARVVAGGTDLIGELKDNILAEYPQVLINLKTIAGLDFIRDEGSRMIIGALTRLEDIAGDSVVKQKLPALAAAAAGTASPHIREMGTLGGNISQSNRCWYYWSPDNRFNCIRKGGKNCYAMTGDGRYHSIFGGVKIKPTPCEQQCPDNIRIPEYMSLIREGNLDAAAGVLMTRNPLPAITGRVCPHSCETECNRQETDEAVSIRAVERYLGDYILNHTANMYPAPTVEIGKKVAIMGSGPCGLSAAYYLRRKGYSVTVKEKMEQAGGLLTYGIPAYRLPKAVVRKQIQALENMGIVFNLNSAPQTAGQTGEILNEYAALLAACGAWKERAARIPGEEYMTSGVQFLHRANTGRAISPGTRIAVVGGGNVAVDVARSLLRMGSQPVIIYRRGKSEMPALTDEVQKAEEEGVRIQFLTLPVEVSRLGNRLALKCRRMELGSPDASGRPRPVEVPGSDFIEEYDAVMKAIGESPDLDFLPAEYKDTEGKLIFNETEFRSADNLFAGGDFVTGPSTVVAAIATGRKAAEAIDKFLGGSVSDLQTEESDTSTEISPAGFNSRYLKPTPRNHVIETPVASRIKGLDIEETPGLETQSFQDEANRCLNCSCVAVNPSDLAPALIVLKAKIVTTRRILEARDFFASGIDRSTVLENDEIMKEVVIPVNQQVKAVFHKFALRKSIDFPLVNIAAALEINDRKVQSAQICLNSVYNEPIRVSAAEELITGQELDEKLADAAAEAGTSKALALVNNRHKINIARVMIKRAILACLDTRPNIEKK